MHYLTSNTPMAVPYIICTGHLHGLDHGIILFASKNEYKSTFDLLYMRKIKLILKFVYTGNHITKTCI